MYTIDIYRIFYTNKTEYTFYSASEGSLSKIDHILGHKTNLYKPKKIKIIFYILFEHNATKHIGSKQISS